MQKSDKQELPQNWKSMKLGEVCEITSSKRIFFSEYKKNGIPFYRSKEIIEKSKGFQPSTELFIDNNKYESIKSQFSVPKKNEILITAVGTIGVIYLISDNDKFYFKDGNLIWIKKILNLISPNFLALSLKTPNLQKKIKDLSSGSSQDALTIVKLNTLLVTIPPLPEQHRIADCLSVWDEGIEKLKKLIETKKKLKKGLMQILLKPFDKKDERQKTLPDWFKSAQWESVRFEDVFYIVNGVKKMQIQTLQYLENGKYPIVDQGQKQIVGYTNQEEIFKDVPVIVFGDHTRIVKYVIFPFGVGADGTQLIKVRGNIDLQFGYFLLCETKIQNLGYSRHLKELKEKRFNLPPLQTQQKIASILSKADEEIELLQKKLENLNTQKKGLMQILLSGKVRFKEFI